MKLEAYTKDLNKTADYCHELSDILTDKGDILKKMADDFGVNIITLNGDPRIVLEITRINKLPAARRILRTVNGSWKDELRQVWTSGKNVLVSWSNADNPLFEIWLCTTPEEFPKELKGENCHFEDRTTIDRVLVCKS